MNVQQVHLPSSIQRLSSSRPSWVRLLRLCFGWIKHPIVPIRAIGSYLLHKRSTAGSAWWRLPSSQRPGVNLIGFVDGEFGMGVMTRSVLTELDRADIPYRIVANEVRGHAFSRSKFHTRVCNENFPVNLVVTTPERWLIDSLRLAREIDLRLPTIGYVAWELEGMPDRFASSMRHFDEVWGISSFCAEQVCKPVDQAPLCLPIGIERPSLIELFDWTKHGYPALQATDYFFVGFCFDAASFVERKNPMDVLRAFQTAFPIEASKSLQRMPRLILKTHNTFLAGQQAHWRSVLEAASGDDRVVILDAKLSTAETWSLLRIFDCYVSLHRAEGLGLTVGEALALGIPTICTAYGGVTDYARLEGFHGVGFQMIPIENGQYVGASGLMWAQPDWLEAASKIQSVYEQSK